MAPDPVMDKLEAAFERQRARLLATDEGRWAVFVQPRDMRRRPKLIGCFDDEFEALDEGYRNAVGCRLMVSEVLRQDRVISIPWGVAINQR